jgi:hypothetical protein
MRLFPEQQQCGSAGALAHALAALRGEGGRRVGRSRFELHDAAGGVARAQGGNVVVLGAASSGGAGTTTAAPLPALWPLALLSTQPGALAAAAAAPAARASGVLRAYCGGVVLPLPPGAQRVVAGQPLALQLPATGCVCVQINCSDKHICTARSNEHACVRLRCAQA